MFSARNRCLRVVGRLASTKLIAVHALCFKEMAREVRGLVVADDGAIADLGAETARVGGDAAGSADKGLGHDRGDDDGRIFLRHADRVTGDIIVDDQIADHQYPHPGDLGERGFELRQFRSRGGPENPAAS